MTHRPQGEGAPPRLRLAPSGGGGAGALALPGLWLLPGDGGPGGQRPSLASPGPFPRDAAVGAHPKPRQARGSASLQRVDAAGKAWPGWETPGLGAARGAVDPAEESAAGGASPLPFAGGPGAAGAWQSGSPSPEAAGAPPLAALPGSAQCRDRSAPGAFARSAGTLRAQPAGRLWPPIGASPRASPRPPFLLLLLLPLPARPPRLPPLPAGADAGAEPGRLIAERSCGHDGNDRDLHPLHRRVSAVRGNWQVRSRRRAAPRSGGVGGPPWRRAGAWPPPPAGSGCVGRGRPSPAPLRTRACLPRGRRGGLGPEGLPGRLARAAQP